MEGFGVNIMMARTATRLGLTDLHPYKKFLRMADQSKKLPLGKLKNIETSMDGVAFNLDYMVLQLEDEQGYEVLIGGPWFYNAGVTKDWTRQELCFQVEGRHRKVRIPWGPTAYHRETPQDDSDELTFAPESAYDSDRSSYGVYMSEREKFREQLQPKVMTTYATVSLSDEKEWKHSEKRGDIVRQSLSDVLNAPSTNKELTAFDGEEVPPREDKMVGATIFRMTEGMIPPES
ncbi:hypothetical protein R1flu_007788 [Riccia fluitans]|uniref:Uncharacterized protein n=1 Tax=Riccia fluitans TaxID=41844 RepID=A0ABD1Z2H7_9MARC